MNNTLNTRDAAVGAATEYDDTTLPSAQVVGAAMIAKALIYVGDRIGETALTVDAERAIEKIGVELGSVAEAIRDQS